MDSIPFLAGIGFPELIIIVVILLINVVPPLVVVAAVIMAVRMRGRQAKTPAPPQVAPGWFEDPTARHQFRYWDGTMWSHFVGDDGIQGEDAFWKVESNQEVATILDSDQPAPHVSADRANPMFWIAIGAIAIVVGIILFFTVGTWLMDLIVVNAFRQFSY